MFSLLRKVIGKKGYSGTNHYIGDLVLTIKTFGSNILFAAMTKVLDNAMKGEEESGFDGMVKGFRCGILKHPLSKVAPVIKNLFFNSIPRMSSDEQQKESRSMANIMECLDNDPKKMEFEYISKTSMLDLADAIMVFEADRML
jgi:hypothetical protein